MSSAAERLSRPAHFSPIVALLALLCGLHVAPTTGPRAAHGQIALDDVWRGDTIRFRLEQWTFDPGRLLRGRFEEATDIGVRYTAVPSEQTGLLPYDELTRLDVRRGTRSLLLEGVAIGGLGGCVVGWGTGEGATDCALGAAIGGIALGLGGLVVRQDRWREIELPAPARERAASPQR